MPVKILVVDDEPDLEALLRQKFRRQTREGVYDFVFAHDGEEALAKLKEFPDVDIILSDINMPRMDGLTLLQRIKESDILARAIVVSAYGDMANIRTAMNRGAFDFLTKPIDFTDLELTLSKTWEQVRVVKEAAKEHGQLEQIRQELRVASNIQLAIIPNVFPPFPGRTDFDLHARMIPAKEVGGDFYDYFLIDDKKLGFMVGDVSGKGVPAAIFMAMSRTLLRATALTGGTAAESLEYVNSILCKEDYASMFVTVLYGVVDLNTGIVTMTSAGHEPPFVMRADGNLELLELPRNLALSIDSPVSFRMGETTLAPGEMIFLYTDGVTEAENQQQAFFGRERLRHILTGSKDLSCMDVDQSVLDAVTEFTAGHPQSDDITCLALRFNGA
ncbi:SpoIIE family protein phosphatase [soil metagenome]